MKRKWTNSLLSVSALALLGAAGCGASSAENRKPGPNPEGVEDVRGSVSPALLRAESCEDLLGKIQDDAVKKLDIAIASYRYQAQRAGASKGDLPVEGPSRGETVDDAAGGGADSGGNTGGGVSAPSDGLNSGEEGEGGSVSQPTGSSDTNTQVKGVDEADFVKVVKMGERMLLLNGADMFVLDSWPAAATKLRGEPLRIEGSPSELFATADGARAVVFSSVYGYGSTRGVEIDSGKELVADVCAPEYCGGGYTRTKVTLVDVSKAEPKVLRELYFEGNYVSSRRYDNIVRGVIQGYSRYQGLFSPEVDPVDPWGRPYENDVIDQQLAAWRERTEAAIRATKLSDWLPVSYEAKAGKLQALDPGCGDYFVPRPGLSDYGLTHVFSLDIASPDGKVGGVTIMGATSTVYSNTEQLVLAQPDYRAFEGDFGLVDQQETAFHLFDIDGAETHYSASGWVPGMLSFSNPQFGIDEKDGALRVATTGWVRTYPDAEPGSDRFWQSSPRNLVLIAKKQGDELKVVGQTKNLGHENETIRSVRFVGDRAYVVTAVVVRDPLVVVDVADPASPKVLGEVEIPGFSEYIHPLDENHLLTLGQSESWGIQLQLFDVSDPLAPKQTSKLDFGSGTYSQASYNHKAFTFYDEEQLLAVPISGYYYDDTAARSAFTAGLQVVHVDAESGLTLVGAVDHGPLFVAQSCGVCDLNGCYAYNCYYAPEVTRGHFVSGDDTTFVYSFSNAGVLVNDLADLKQAVASVPLPQPVYDGGVFYTDPTTGGGSTPSGGSSGGDFGGEPSIDPVPPSDVIDADAGAAIGL